MLQTIILLWGFDGLMICLLCGMSVCLPFLPFSVLSVDTTYDNKVEIISLHVTHWEITSMHLQSLYEV